MPYFVRRAVTSVFRSLLELDGIVPPNDGPVFGLDGKQITLVEPDTFNRLRKCKRQMKKAGILATAGYTPPEKGESVQVLWNKHGWQPPRNGLKLRAEQVIEIQEHIEPANVRTIKKAARS